MHQVGMAFTAMTVMRCEWNQLRVLSPPSAGHAPWGGSETGCAGSDGGTYLQLTPPTEWQPDPPPRSRCGPVRCWRWSSTPSSTCSTSLPTAHAALETAALSARTGSSCVCGPMARAGRSPAAPGGTTPLEWWPETPPCSSRDRGWRQAPPKIGRAHV